MVLLKKLLNSWFDEFFFSVRENFSFFHTVWQNFTLKIRESNGFTKEIARYIEWILWFDEIFAEKKKQRWFLHLYFVFTEIFQKTVIQKFRKLHSVYCFEKCDKARYTILPPRESWNQLFSNFFFSKNVDLTKKLFIVPWVVIALYR